jgi:hypothetical protein
VDLWGMLKIFFQVIDVYYRYSYSPGGFMTVLCRYLTILVVSFMLFSCSNSTESDDSSDYFDSPTANIGSYFNENEVFITLPTVNPNSFSLDDGSSIEYSLVDDTAITISVRNFDGVEVLRSGFSAGTAGASQGGNELTINSETFETQLESRLYYLTFYSGEDDTLLGYYVFNIED